MPAEKDPDVQVGMQRRSHLVSRRTAAEISGLSLPQVDYWIRRGVVGGGPRSRWLPRLRTGIDVLALMVAVDLRGRGVPVREIQAVLPYVLADDHGWHPMGELVDLDTLHERITMATAKVTTSTVPAVSALAAEQDEQPAPRNRGLLIAVVVAAVVVAAGIVVAIVLTLPAARPAAGAPTAPEAPGAGAPAAVPTPDPATAPPPVAPAARPSVVVAPVVIAPSRPAAQPPAADVAPPVPGNVPAADPAGTGAGAAADNANGGTADDGSAARDQSGTPGGDQPSGGVLDGIGSLFGG